MRILFIPRDDADRVFGGDVVQMRKTAEALRDLGAVVDLGTVEHASGTRYDVVHLWTSLHFPTQLLEQLEQLAGVRDHTCLALSTIWAPHHLVRWMDAARRWLFTRHQDGAKTNLQSAENDLRAIASRQLDFTLDDGKPLTAFAPHPGVQFCREVLRQVDVILPNSWMELAAIFTYLGDLTAHAVVPNAVDAHEFEAADPSDLPQELRPGHYAMMSARFDTRKQQDFAMLAIKDLDIPMVFVGDPTDQEIFARMKALASNRAAPVFYYPFLPHSRLRHLYAGARVHLLPSIFESPGLSSMEAALLDCSIVTGNLAFESEYFQDGAYYCDPCDAFSIERAVRDAWESYDDEAHRRQTLAQRIRSAYTWHHAAEATLRAYRHRAIKTTPASAQPTPDH
jgi:glycosyltransferase involved in cell wall biosynthesis